jgi:NDP-sugar pyrophosphorylase family protein
MKALVFAAGMGTRLKPLTDTMPKALVPVLGKPLLAHVIEKLKSEGFDDITVNVHHFADQIEKYLSVNDFGVPVHISDERDLLRETGGGVRHARPFLEGSPFLVHNVDIISNINLRSLISAAREDALSTIVVSDRKTKRYFLFDESMRLVGWTNIETGEVKSPYKGLNPADLKMLAFSGIHMIWPRVFPLFSEMPERFGIIDFYLKYCHQCAFLGYEKKDLQLMDVGKIDTLEQAEPFIKQL